MPKKAETRAVNSALSIHKENVSDDTDLNQGNIVIENAIISPKHQEMFSE